MTEGSEDRHEFDRVEYDKSYVLVCSCGWRSSASELAGAVGEEWDHHRASDTTTD